MLITLTIINWLLRLLDVYSIILVIYALMSWIPTLYGTWFGRIIVKVSRPYLSLFENLRFSSLYSVGFTPLNFLNDLENANGSL